MKIVLVEPEIPPNTGNVARLCAATRVELHLIEPLGFHLDDRTLKRAGMDYWQAVVWRKWKNWTAFKRSLAPSERCWFIESGGPTRYSEVDFLESDCLVFGRETAGLPPGLLKQYPKRHLGIPMFNAQARSLNLSNCVARVLFEALRQQGFPGALT